MQYCYAENNFSTESNYKNAKKKIMKSQRRMNSLAKKFSSIFLEDLRNDRYRHYILFLYAINAEKCWISARFLLRKEIPNSNNIKNREIRQKKEKKRNKVEDKRIEMSFEVQYQIGKWKLLQSHPRVWERAGFGR